MFVIVADFWIMSGSRIVDALARSDSLEHLQALTEFDPDTVTRIRFRSLSPQQQTSLTNIRTGGSLDAHICSVST